MINCKTEKVKYKSINLHADLYENEKKDAPVLIVVHGTGSYSNYYDKFCTNLCKRGFTVIPFDLMGHGKSGGKRGVFTMKELIDNVITVISFAAEKYNDNIGVIGTSQGGEIAFHAAQQDHVAKSVVCHNILLSCEFPLNFKVRFFQSPLCAIVPDFYFPLEKAFNWKDAYNDPEFLKKKKSDPYVVWHYKFKSYRTIFTHKPNKPIDEMTTPSLIAVGEDDKLVSAKHCKKVYDRLTCQKEFHLIPNAGHQLLVDYTDKFVPIVDKWFKDTLG